MPGANGSLGWTGVIFAEPPPSAAGLVQSTSMPALGGRGRRWRPAGGGSSNVENAIDAADLRPRAAGADVLEVAARVLALLDRHVAAEQDRRDELAADLGLRVDLLADELAQHERALRVADQHDAAAVVVVRR